MNNKETYIDEIVNVVYTDSQIDEIDFEGYSALFLVKYLKESHKNFFNITIPQIEHSLFLLIKQSDKQCQLDIVFNLFIKFQYDLKLHVAIEENKIFPYVVELSAGARKRVLRDKYSINSIDDFAESHESAEIFVSEIIRLIELKQVYMNPLLSNILLGQLRDFDKTLQTHAWIEESLLVEKVKQLETTYK